MDNSLQMVSYYAFHDMMKPVSNINRIMTAALFFFADRYALYGLILPQYPASVKDTHRKIKTGGKEHKLRNQAELRQLQLQIHPHFLYNSLSYIVTVADQPDAVTERQQLLPATHRTVILSTMAISILMNLRM